jgi:transcriptional regulator with PAS, ATPase and Fis domain
LYTLSHSLEEPRHLGSSSKHNASSQPTSETARVLSGVRESVRLPIIQVVGSGESLDSLRAPRFVGFGQTLEVGRRPGGEGADVLALHDRTVSGRHVRISRLLSAGEDFRIEDLGSTNGTFASGRRIQGSVPLHSGTLLFLGSQVLVFRLVTQAELAALEQEAAQPFGPVPTLSPSLALTLAKLRLLAGSNAEILLVGETGVGKDVFAHAVHAASRRAGKLVAINCAAIPRELAESELFGYEKGAHSTAQGRKAGLVEAANGGTLFLDEIGDMPAELQPKLLRFLQDRRFTPLGSTRTIEADVRVVAATSRTAVVKGAHLQEALLGRLGAQPILLPPLRERIEDVGRLAAHFLDEAGVGGAGTKAFEPEAFHALLLHGWPLNVRELSKVIHEAAVLSRGAAIGLEHLPDAVTGTLQVEGEDAHEDTLTDAVPRGMAETDTGRMRDLEKSHGGRARRRAPTAEELTTLLARFQGSVAEVARQLNRQYAVVWRCIQRYGIDAGSYRPGGGGGGHAS